MKKLLTILCFLPCAALAAGNASVSVYVCSSCAATMTQNPTTGAPEVQTENNWMDCSYQADGGYMCSF